METNYWAILVAALSCFLMGFIWYNPNVMGKVWMKECGLTDEDLKKGNPVVLFSLAFLFSFMLSFYLQTVVIHQFALSGLAIPEKGYTDPEIVSQIPTMIEELSGKFRTFRHGALHGFIFSLMAIFPIIAINALFEKKSWRYILINAGYWAVSITLMGAIICGWK